MYSKLQYISQGNTIKEHYNNIYRVLDAGCKWIQLRVKNQNLDNIALLAENTKKLCVQYQATFIVNDYITIAQSIDADGVHLGLEDTPIEKARKILGNSKIIGGTANTLNDVIQRYNEKCNYIGLGPYRFTSTKKNLSPVLGIEGYLSIMNEIKRMGISIPIYAIGGINIDDAKNLINTGIYGLAVSSALTQKSDIEKAIYDFYRICNKTVNV